MMEMETAAMTGGGPPLPPGYRFYPTEEELLTFYLRHCLAGTRPDVHRLIPVLDIYTYHPSQLQAMAGAANRGDPEQWFFFCPRAEREVHGGRPARTTPSGCWKATGSPSYVYSTAAAGGHVVIGERRTMVFYEGRAPTGTKARWKMNEYKAVASDDSDSDAPAPPAAGGGVAVRLRNEFSVCRVYVSTGTLRSFNRRPLNPPVVAAAGHHQNNHQQLLPPPPATAAANQMMPATAVVVDAGGGANDGHAAAAENSPHDDSSSSAGSRGGGGVDDGADEDAATAPIDWGSLITPVVDDLRFSVRDDDDDLSRVIWPRR